jgi:hypothetical protein
MEYRVYKWLRGSGRCILARVFDDAPDATAYVAENNADLGGGWIYGTADPEEEEEEPVKNGRGVTKMRQGPNNLWITCG